MEKKQFKTESQKLLDMMINSIYTHKEIFLRELISNASDAIDKLYYRSLTDGTVTLKRDEYEINIKADKDNRTLLITDNGCGMTMEELENNLGTIAKSGSFDFKKDNADQKDVDVIGQFGVGFYSAFMVSDRVEVLTKSYTNAPAVHWSCDENGEYETALGERDERGTTVIMHVAETEKEYLSASKIRAMLEKYCSFMPVEIYFEDTAKEDEEKTSEPVNDIHPLWQKQPSECSDEEYKEFYRKVFLDYKEPLFHIHINADYPLNFKGILYFPKLANEYETIEGQVKLYYNQVYVADNIKEVIPEYLLMLKGVLDCPELPLNVSRSYLQTNTYVSKVSAHIVKKVADKLCGLCNNDRDRYAEIWKDISPFIEYACMKDKKFYDRVKKALLLTLTDGSAQTFEDYLSHAKDRHENKIYYATDKDLQAQYIAMFEAQGISVALFDKPIDTQFAALLEQYMENVQFLRVDADVADVLKADGNVTENEALKAIFTELMGGKGSVRFDALKDDSIPAMLNVSEQARRMEEMMRFYRMAEDNALPTESTLILNTASPLIQKLEESAESEPEKTKEMAAYIYKLSLLSQKKFSAEEMQAFMKDSVALLMKL